MNYDFCIISEGETFSGEYRMNEYPGCCGIATINSLKVNRLPSTRYKEVFASCLYEDIKHNVLNCGYNILTMSSIPPGGVSDWDCAYFDDVDASHREGFNLYDIAKAGGMRVVSTTVNGNTGNKICLFSQVIGHGGGE